MAGWVIGCSWVFRAMLMALSMTMSEMTWGKEGEEGSANQSSIWYR